MAVAMAMATARAMAMARHGHGHGQPWPWQAHGTVAGSFAHNFVQKTRSVSGHLAPKVSLIPPLLRWFGGASLNPLLNDLGGFLELVFIALPPELAMFRGAFLRLFLRLFFLNSPSPNRTVAGGFA